MDEVRQQEMARIQGRAQVAMEALMAAHTAAGRLVGLGGLDFRPDIQQALTAAEALQTTVGHNIGPVEPHRGLRTPPVCGDPACPVHGESVFDSETRARVYGSLACAMEKKARTADDLCTDVDCPIASTREPHKH